MNTQVRHPILELGTFSVVVPLVWLIAGLFGFVLLANRPELFAEPAKTQPGTQLSAAAPPEAIAAPVAAPEAIAAPVAVAAPVEVAAPVAIYVSSESPPSTSNVTPAIATKRPN
jgi:hypothetical protein